MQNAESQDFQAELVLLKEQVKSQLEAHRLEVAAALEQLAGARAASVSGSEFVGLQSRILEWERCEIQLSERIAAKTIEYQALRARTELDRYRQQLQIDDLQKQLALRDTETASLKSVLEALMAEHAECTRNPTAPADSPREQANLLQLKAQLENSQLECADLRHSMESSLALKLARSLSWLLTPVRSMFAKRPDSTGAKS